MVKPPRSAPESSGTENPESSRQPRGSRADNRRRSATTPATRQPATPVSDSELPVVARLVVEIRSDGTRTITRGAIEDVQSGESVAIEARANSPLELSLNLAKMLLQAPALASNSLRGTLPTPAALRSHARARLVRLGRRLRQRFRGDNSDNSDGSDNNNNNNNNNNN